MEYTELYYQTQIYGINTFIILLVIIGIFTGLFYLLNKWWKR